MDFGVGSVESFGSTARVLYFQYFPVTEQPILLLCLKFYYVTVIRNWLMFENSCEMLCSSSMPKSRYLNLLIGMRLQKAGL